MITIVDYGMGNLRSVQKAFEKVGFPAVITSKPRVVAKASRLVLPGVGAFPDCMKNLRKLKLIDPILKAVADRKPFLGICLGLQLLFEESDEFGRHKGLGLIPGRVVRFRLAKSLKVPHMGWNRIKKVRRLQLLAEIPDGAYLYFVHSYYVVPEDPDLVVTTTEHGREFCSSISRDRLFACQFHPEKSQKAGLILLKAFADGKL